jgi:hypothetical protein
MTSCLTNLDYYSHVNPNLQLTVLMTSVSHSLGCAWEPTVLHPLSSDYRLICYRFCSQLRIQLSAMLSGCGMWYLLYLRPVESRLPAYLSTASFHGSAFNPLQSRRDVDTLFHPYSHGIKGTSHF